jgi:hypothetical protein
VIVRWIVRWDPGLREGDLVTVDGISGSYTLWSFDHDRHASHFLPQTGIFLGVMRVDYTIDMEDTPIVLLDGRKMLVGRGSVRRVE